MREEIELYKVVYAENAGDRLNVVANTAKYGFVLDKRVDIETLLAVTHAYNMKTSDASILCKTLFTKEEALRTSTEQKILEQITHYISGGHYGKQQVEIEGKTVSVDMLRVVDKEELRRRILHDIYGSRPLSSEKVLGIYTIVNRYSIDICESQINNNEYKMLLLKDCTMRDPSGDDVLRYIIHTVNPDTTLLIKSQEVIDSLKNSVHNFDAMLEQYETQLAKVFNRHKPLILALKNRRNARIINRISKLSKWLHTPIKEAINKRLLSVYLNSNMTKAEALRLLNGGCSVIDKFKYINLLRAKKEEHTLSVYKIRNGKVFYKENTEKYTERHDVLYDIIIESLQKDLGHLKGRKIKYPDNVDYGLPISEKQALGHLPFGTIITAPEGKSLSAGMYWENSGGAGDLDLSSVSATGARTGWGQYSGYDHTNGVMFSGDIVDAVDGAIEYISVDAEAHPQILINTIYSGEDKAKYKLVVGTTDKKSEKYLDNPIIEIDTAFIKRTESLGVLRHDKFVVYKSGLSGASISSPRDKAILPYIDTPFMTMKELFDIIGVSIVDEDFDIDLSVGSVTFDKLFEVFHA